MRTFWISLALLGSNLSAFSAAEQQLVPIIHETKTASASSLSEWKTFVRMEDYGGATYVSLVQIAELLDGQLRWHTVSKTVDLSIAAHTIRFPYYVPSALINGRRVPLDGPTVKNENGFWVPISFFASEPFFRATRSRLEWPPKAAGPTANSEPPAEKPEAVTHSLPADRSLSAAHVVKRIVIDPGHGGKDPGAVGPRGEQEKAINLRLAQGLADVLRETYGYEVLLTRMDDTFIPLEERAKLANKHNADLFISLHCNASTSPNRKGFEVYFLSEKASDSHADAVARLENAVLSLEGKEVPSPNRVKAVLRSLVKTANINEASALGSLLDRHLADRLGEPSVGVKQAAFYVLRGAEMPAILIEAAFISNPQEERLLADANFQKKLIEGITAGVLAYDARKVKERT